MKGHLYKTETNKWLVNYDSKIIALHPEIELQPNPFNNYGEGCDVNFIIVDEFTHTESFSLIGGGGTPCALLISDLLEQEINSESILLSIKKLEKENPNDADFGKNVRELLKT